MARDEYEEEIDSDQLKEQLVAELDAARIDLRRAKTRVAHRLDVKTQAKRYVKDHQKILISAAIPIAGLVLYKTLFAKKKKTSRDSFRRASLVKSVSGLVVGMIIKPYVRKWAMRKASDYITQRLGGESSSRPVKKSPPLISPNPR